MTPPKRRWFRYSLRTLFVVLTLLCLWLGLVKQRADTQRNAVQTLRDAGAQVNYNFEYVSPIFASPTTTGPLTGTFVAVPQSTDQVSPAPLPGPDTFSASNLGIASSNPVASQAALIGTISLKQMPIIKESALTRWLRERLGDDYFYTVKSVHFPAAKTALPDDVVAALEKLTAVENLELYPAAWNARTVRMLRRMPNLKSLDLNHYEITDAELASLSHLRNLELLSIDSKRVTDAGLTHLRGLRNLMNLDLHSAEVTDAGLVHLKSLPLAIICLRDSSVTSQGARTLAQIPTIETIVGVDLDDETNDLLGARRNKSAALATRPRPTTRAPVPAPKSP